MTWLILSLITALSVAVRDVSIKAMFKRLKPLEIAVMELSFALPVLAVACLSVPVPSLDRTFWWTFLVSLPINITAYVIYLFSIKFSPISLSVPFLAFTPVFMLFTGAVVLNESATYWGALGVGMIVLGSYILNFSKTNHGFLRPFAALFHETGSWMMLIVAVLYAFAAVIAKKAMLHSSPLFFSYFFFLVFNLTILAGLFLGGQADWGLLKKNTGKGFWLAGLLLAHISCHALAITGTAAVYMIAVKRSSILFSVILSWLFLKEGEITTRGMGTVLMFGGMLLITILG